MRKIQNVENMVRTFDVINEIRDQLLNNIRDPNSNRRSDNLPWVYTHQPNSSTLPTVQIKEVDTNYNTLSIGNLTQFESSRIQITVRVRTNSEYDYNTDDELETASDGLDWLLSKIVDVILDNHSTILNNVGENLKSVLPDLESDVIDVPNSDAIEKSVDFVALIQK